MIYIIVNLLRIFNSKVARGRLCRMKNRLVENLAKFVHLSNISTSIEQVYFRLSQNECFVH